MTDYCCTPDSGDCCGPGSWCCGKAGKHDHEEAQMGASHIDQMKAWWQEADNGIPKAGDTIIADERHRGHGFYVYQATKDHPHGYDNIRVLRRAPAPQPDPDVIVATLYATSNSHTERVALTWDDRGVWVGVDSDGTVRYIRSGELCDPVPLIEAKVTGEMVKRASAANYAPKPAGETLGSYMRHILTAALGLDPA